jgi:hypothetical protein
MSIVLYARTVPDFRHGLLETTNVMWDDLQVSLILAPPAPVSNTEVVL